MEAEFFLEALWGYLRDRLRLVLAFFSFAGIFLLVPGLSHSPMGPMLYAALLAFSLGGVLLCLGFLSFYRRHTALRLQYIQSGERFFENPPAGNLIEEDYQRLLLLCRQKLQEQQAKTDRQRKQAQEYYTAWAHQIKTPLSAIRLLLQEDAPAPKEELRQELFKITQYTDMVLQYLRLDGGGRDLVLRRYTLEDILKQAVKRVSTLFIYKKLSLRLAETPLSVVTDEKWLVFVLEQLLSNAVKYTPKGEVAVYLSPAQPRTLIIEDTGIGILPEDLPRIFEWGFTGYNGRLDKRSTGIGLFLCRQALELLGHQISFCSQPGKGTKVSLHFPEKPLLIE